jgi:hypothetical protein
MTPAVAPASILPVLPLMRHLHWLNPLALVTLSITDLTRKTVNLVAPFHAWLIWLGLKMHDLAHLVLCRIRRSQPTDPSLPSSNIWEKLPMP